MQKKNNDDEEEGDEEVQLSARVQNLQVLKKKSLKEEFISCNQSMLMIMTMANTDCGQG